MGCCPPRSVLRVHNNPSTQDPVFGEAFAATITDIMPTPVGQWMPVTDANVTLPEPGDYQLTADVRARVIADPGSNAYISARLFDNVAGIPLPNSERFINQAVGDQGTRNLTGPVGAFISVTQPTSIQLEVKREGQPTSADIRSDGNGRTRLAFLKIGGG